MQVKEIKDLTLLQNLSDSTKVLVQDDGTKYANLKTMINQGTVGKADLSGAAFTGDVTVGSSDSNKNLTVNGNLKVGENPVATLDPLTNRIPSSQLPESAMEYKGTWNATTNTPTLVDGTGTSGDMYKVSVAGKHTFNGVELDFYVGDFVMYNGTYWERSSGGLVQSVCGKTGIVDVTTEDVTGSSLRTLYAWKSVNAVEFDIVYTTERKPKTGSAAYIISDSKVTKLPYSIADYHKTGDIEEILIGSAIFSYSESDNTSGTVNQVLKDSLEELYYKVDNKEKLKLEDYEGNDVEYNGNNEVTLSGIKKSNTSRSIESISIGDLKYNETRLGSTDIDTLITDADFWNALDTESLISYYTCYSSVEKSYGYLVYFNTSNPYAEVHLENGAHFTAKKNATSWETLNYGGGSSSPIGTIHSYVGTSAPAGFLLCDGTEYLQSDYLDLYNIVKTLDVCKSTKTGYFKVPDLRNKFIEGSSSNLGKDIAAGLPNITGSWQYETNCNTVESTATLSGALTKGTQTSANRTTISNTGNTYAGYSELQFDASKSNSIYGNSTTVQPPAVTLNFIIKATKSSDSLNQIIDDTTTDVGHSWSGSKINDCICNSGKTYIVTPVNTSTSSTLTIPDNIPLVAGNIIRIFVNGNCKATSTSTTVSNFDLYLCANNFTNKNIFCYRNGQKAGIYAKKISNYAMYIQKGIVLELIWDGENWVVLGNPVVLSNDAVGSPTNRYKYYADGSSAFISIDFANVVKNFTVSQTEQTWTATCDCFLNASIGGFNGTYGYVKINDVAVLNQTTGSAALINYENLSVFVKKGDVIKYKEGYTTNLSTSYGQPYCVCYALSYR